jgi:hypothetical protein
LLETDRCVQPFLRPLFVENVLVREFERSVKNRPGALILLDFSLDSEISEMDNCASLRRDEMIDQDPDRLMTMADSHCPWDDGFLLTDLQPAITASVLPASAGERRDRPHSRR